MKNIFYALLIAIFTITALNAEASIKYTAHTHQKEIDSLKKRSFKWVDGHRDNKKQYYTEYVPNHHKADREVDHKKGKAFAWHDGHVKGGKQYYSEYAANHHLADREVEYKKKSAFAWYKRDSW